MKKEPTGDSGVPLDSIDPILEKISKTGMGSLSFKERALLEKARAELIEKDRTH